MLRGLALALITTAIGCGTDDTDGDPANDPCGDLGCASFPGSHTLTVLDSTTGEPVATEIRFEDESGELPFSCGVDFDEEGGVCPSWTLSIIGRFDVEVSAPGYQPAIVEVLIEGPEGCCGAGPDTSDTLELDPS